MRNYDETNTIEQFIQTRNSNTINYDKLSIYETTESGHQIITYNVLNDYYDEIMEQTLTVTLTEKEYERYCYKPKLLAHDVYNSIDLFFILLFTNNMSSVKEFNLRKIKMIPPENLMRLLSQILLAEDKNLLR